MIVHSHDLVMKWLSSSSLPDLKVDFVIKHF